MQHSSPHDQTRKRGPDPIDVEVGRRIRIERTLRGISQSTLGRALGITFQQVQKYEKGTNRVGAGRLMRIAKELGVPVGALLGADGETVKELSDGSNTLEYLALPGAIRLLQAFAQIEDKGTKSAFIDLAERIAGVLPPPKTAQPE
jgi:transcriptional regulator with XRE-family HTH domain